MTGRPPPRVELAIDEVVVRGVPHGQVPAVVAALERELAALVATDQVAVRALVAGGVLAVRPGARTGAPTDAAGIGAHAARGVWRAVKVAGGGADR